MFTYQCVLEGLAKLAVELMREVQTVIKQLCVHVFDFQIEWPRVPGDVVYT